MRSMRLLKPWADFVTSSGLALSEVLCSLGLIPLTHVRRHPDRPRSDLPSKATHAGSHLDLILSAVTKWFSAYPQLVHQQ